MTIDQFNKLTGHDTLHPLVCTVHLPQVGLQKDLCVKCGFYGLLYCDAACRNGQVEWECLRLVRPGDLVKLPLRPKRQTGDYSGVLFHPDLLCGTSLEQRIDTYPCRCHCRGALSEHERGIITGNLREIDAELNRAIDRHSASIIVSRIELLLNYCVRFCTQ